MSAEASEISTGTTAPEVATVTVENPKTGVKLVMSAPRPLSDEAQHVINSLEAHFAAVREAVKHGTPGTMQHAWEALESVHEHLAKWGLRLVAHETAMAERDAERTGAEIPVAAGAGGLTGSASFPPPGSGTLAEGAVAEQATVQAGQDNAAQTAG